MGCFKLPGPIKRAKNWYEDHRKFLTIFGSFILATPLLAIDEINETKFKCLYVVIVMGVLWVFESLPLAITALLPMVLFPCFGIMKSEAVAKTYLPDTGFLFVGGLMVAVAVEKSNLHTRVALKVLSITGSNPRWIMLGFMTVTAFLSMWISNTATAALMVPIVQSVISELVDNQRHGEMASLTNRQSIASRRRSIEGRRLSMANDPLAIIAAQTAKQDIEGGKFIIESESKSALVEHMEKNNCSLERIPLRTGEEGEELAAVSHHLIPFPAEGENHHVMTRPIDDQELLAFRDICKKYSPRELKMAKGMLLSVCFAANIGGAATITGTASNLVLIGQLEKIFPGADTGINFLSWILFSFGHSVVNLIGCWVIICVIFLSDAPTGSTTVTIKLKEKYNRLPRVSFAECSVTVCFLVLLFFWMFRDPKIIAGLQVYFKKGYVTDATSAIFIVIVLFILPEKWPKRACDMDRGLLDWATIQANFPWSVVLLLGGGFALAAGVKESQLSLAIGEIMKHLGELPTVIAVTICVIITVMLTNICSNTVVASIFIPIVAELARSLELNPLLFMLPVTLSCSNAFLLPVATPPNAIVFASGVLDVKDMAVSGVMVTIWCTIVNLANVWLVAFPLFNLHIFPEWANYNEILAGNATSLLVDILTMNQNETIGIIAGAAN